MNPDNKIMNFLNKLGDMFILNILYLVCCIPVITIGAATTALYYNTLKLAENREAYVWKDFLRAFRENFLQATLIWLMMLAVFGVLAINVLTVGGLGEQLGAMVAVASLVFGIFFVMTGVYVFPLLARFDNTVFRLIKFALLMSIRHFPSTVVIVAVHGIPLLLALISLQAFVRGVGVVLLFVVSILAYIESKLFSRIFVRYYPKETPVEALKK